MASWMTCPCGEEFDSFDAWLGHIHGEAKNEEFVDRLCLEGYVLVEKAEYDRLVALEDR